MKKIQFIALLSACVVSLCSCNKNKRHDISEYQIYASQPYIHDNGQGYYNILQLSDLHLGVNSDRNVQFAFIKKTIDLANEAVNKQEYSVHNGKVDLIVVSGDVFTFASKEVAKSFCAFMDEQKINWTVTFGNHDEQCYFSVEWLTSYLNNLTDNNKDSYCLFRDIQDDDVYGNANFFISIQDKKGGAKEEERVYLLDSNRYRYGEYFAYDYIHSDQIDFYDRASRYLGGVNGYNEDPSQLHSLMFFHIPLHQYAEFYNYAKEGSKAEFVKEVGTGDLLDKRGEEESTAKEDSGLYNKIVELKTTKGIFVGHDHINNYSVIDKLNFVEPTEQIMLSYGVKGTDAIYGDEDQMGGQLISLTGEKKNKTISIKRILHKYADLEVK